MLSNEIQYVKVTVISAGRNSVSVCVPSNKV